MPEINIARWTGPEIPELTANLIALAENYGWKVGLEIDEPEARFTLTGSEHRDELLVAVAARIEFRKEESPRPE